MASFRSLGTFGIAAVCAALCLQAFPAGAQLVPCQGSLQLGNNLSIAGRCELENTEIRGNVTLFPGGSLTARNLRIRGTLEGSRADFVDMENSRVDREINLQELVGDLTSFASNDLRGKVVLTGNRSRLELLNNDIAGDVEARNNTGGVLISGNAIDRNLKCSGNSPAPVGIGNRVAGNSEGQCEDLQAEAPTPPPAEPPPTTPPPTTPPPETPPPETPPPETPPPTTPPPTTTTPPTSSPPPAAPTTPTPDPVDPLADEGGGAGALDWTSVLLLLPLLAWTGFERRRRR